MSRTTSNFTGLTQAINKLTQFRSNIPSIVNDELSLLGKNITTRAKVMAPKKSGVLRKGIRYSVLNGRLYVYAHAYNKRTGYDYAPIQHNNPSYHHPVGEYLFLTKAVEIETKNFKRRIQRRLRPK